MHVALSGETTGYYADFEPLTALKKVVEQGFFHDGTHSSFRGRDHGVPIDTDHTATWRLVVANQNHDQVGNRAVGDRLSDPAPGHLDDDQLGCAAMLTLLGPFTPMLFQGEEWAASTPFQFFTSHPEPELGTATAEGRIAEFEQMGWDPAVVPDPQDPATFERSKLDWSEREDGRHARLLDLYRVLGRLRREWPELTDPSFAATTCDVDEAARLVVLHRGRLQVVLNLGETPLEVHTGPGHVLAGTASGAELDAQGLLVLPRHAGAVVRA